VQGADWTATTLHSDRLGNVALHWKWTNGEPRLRRHPRRRVMAIRVVRSDRYGNSGSLEYRFRQKRYRHIRALIDQILARHGRCRIIDIGGTEWYWRIASGHVDDERIQIDLINLEANQSTKPNFRNLVGDACDLHEFDDLSYDLVHSNSVIEHVGTWDAMLRMASNVRRLAPAYFVQTPYFWFPIEPHFRFPFFHWVPESWRYRLIMTRDLGYVSKASSVSDAVRSVQSAVLLDQGQLSALFPDAEIRCERVFGLIKSLMAVRVGS
jgi:Methyltransferase domain